MPEYHTERGYQARCSGNIVSGLARSFLAKAGGLRWSRVIVVNPFPDTIGLTEEVRKYWSEARTQLGSPKFADANPATNDQIGYS